MRISSWTGHTEIKEGVLSGTMGPPPCSVEGCERSALHPIYELVQSANPLCRGVVPVEEERLCPTHYYERFGYA